MNSYTTIARPYATAAFSVAKADNQLNEWSTALKKLSFAAKNKAMAEFIKNPGSSKTQLRELLSVFASSPPVKNFIWLLTENKRLYLLPEISALFEMSCAKESGYLALTVTTAVVTDHQEKIIITEKLSTQLRSKLKIDFRVDEKLMGGMLVRSQDWVIDDTIAGKLKRLATALI